MTVHRLLEYTPNGGGFNFGKNDGDPLDADAIIIDEASMLDITLTYHLLKAVQGGCRLILSAMSTSFRLLVPDLF